MYAKGFLGNTYSVHKALSLWLVGAYVKYPQLHSQLLFACYTTYEMAKCACVWYVNVHHCYLVGLTAYRTRTGPSSTSLYCKNTLTQIPCFVSGTVDVFQAS